MKMKTMLAMGVMSIAGYCYMMNNKKMMKKAKKMIKEAAKNIYNSIDKLDCQD